MARFCTNCGNKIEDGQTQCMSCGNVIGSAQPQSSNNGYNNNNNYNNNYNNMNGGQRKSRVAAGVLGILLGCFGVHNFYLGYTGKAVAQLLLTLVGWILCGLGPVAAGIWGLIEGIMILTGSISRDGYGNPLGE